LVLPDDLEQRSIIIEMQRRRPDELLAELRDDRCEALHKIARMCLRWAQDHAHDLGDPDMGGGRIRSMSHAFARHPSLGLSAFLVI
jgi:hypothetical protein